MHHSRRSLAAGRWPLACSLIALLLSPAMLPAQEKGANALGDAIAGLGTTMRVLVIAAHPDDEDTRLITWLTKGHRAEVAYLSLTRGDGGQNLIGNELGEALGVIRTQELLTARRLDGAHQYFSRAYDFGFSKSAEETYKHWPHDSLLKDVITVVRAFRPQVIITVFTGTPRDGHGQHQVSAILGREAYDLAGDSVRFPAKSTQGLVPWTVSKFYRGRSYFGPPFSYQYDAGEYDPLLGLSYAELAVISRSQHRSQGTGALPRKGPSPGYLMREATRVNVGTDSTKEKGIFDGIDTTWVAQKGFTFSDRYDDSISLRLARMQSSFDPWHPEQTTGHDLAALLVGPKPGATVSFTVGYEFWHRLQDKAGAALLLAHGIVVEAAVDRDVVAVGDTIPAVLTIYNRGASPIDVWKENIFVSGAAVKDTRTQDRIRNLVTIQPNSALRDTVLVIGMRPSQPWWLVSPRRGDMFGPPVSTVGEDLLQSPARVEGSIYVEGHGVSTSTSVVHRYADPVKGGIEHPLMVAPAVTLTLDTQVEYVPANAAVDRTIHVRLRSATTAARTVKVSLKMPKGLTADSVSRTVQLAALGAATVDFHVRGSLPVGSYTLAATAESNGQTFTTGYQLIDYDHIRPQTLYRDATMTLQAVDIAIPTGANVAYIPGVGDNSAAALQQLGIPVTILDPATLASADLSPYTAVVIGSRAYEAHPELVANNARLLDWVKRGGTMVVQYGQYEMTRPGIMPYRDSLTRPAARVTEEDAVVTVLAPKDPLLNTPNRIGPADWKGWVQDFALYMPTTFDSAYTPLVSLHDTGEPANSGGILVARYGNGTYVYTTLAFFRQLPAGVPGAARLFVNLLGARQADAPRITP
jgi:LmbE family N-acetylglucosaminyl deacetylase